jgi:oligopeptide transport system substrate-binding protein
MFKLARLSRFVIMGAILIQSACSAPLPTTTPVPPSEPLPSATPTMVARATATALPQATSTPEATPLPTPEPSPTPASGYYRDLELGFWFLFPDEWAIENTGIDLPAVIVSDPDDPVKVMAGATILEADLSLEEIAANLIDELGLAEIVTLVSNEAAVLGDGSAAQKIAISWEDEDGVEMLGRGMVTAANGKGFLVLLYGRPETIEARPQTVEVIAGSLRLEQPELFGVSRNNALVLSIIEPATLDPAMTHEKAAGVVGHVFSGLVRLNPELGLDPDIAESWEVSDNGKVYTFHLREDAQFHDGRPITSAAVKASWERATNPELDSPTAAAYLGDIVGVSERIAGEADDISGLEVLDLQTLRVTIDSPKPYFLFKLAQPATFVIDEGNLDSGDQWWRQPNGSGPFKLHSWRPGNVIVLNKNEAYLPSAPEIDSVIYYLGEAGLPAYEAGQVDAAEVSYWNLARVQDPGEAASVDLHSGHRYCTWQVAFNSTNPPFDEQAVRQAFSMAIDRGQLANNVLQNAAVPASSILPPGMPGYIERPASISYDLAQAEVLLAESSHQSASALPDLIMAAAGIGSPEPFVTALINQWETNLGVKIEVELLDPVHYPDLVRNHQANMYFLKWCADYPDPENILDTLFHSSGYGNIGGYANPEVDSILEHARTEMDNVERLRLYQEAETLIEEDAPMIQLVHPLSHTLVRPYVQSFQLSPIEVVWPAYVSIEREE